MLKNFAILTRIFTEKHSSILFWKALKDKGLDPRDAFYLCAFFFYNNGVITEATLSSIAGRHWSLTDYINPYSHVCNLLDWNIYYSGQVNHKKPSICTENINYIFLSKVKEKYEPFKINTDKLTKKITKGKFSTVSSFDIDEIIIEFYAWKELNVKIKD